MANEKGWTRAGARQRPRNWCYSLFTPSLLLHLPGVLRWYLPFLLCSESY